MEQREGWQAPEAIIDKIRVTTRPFRMLYEQLSLGDESFRDKISISLGNGLSDLVEHVNELGDETKCYGIDPIYAYLGETYEEFSGNLRERDLDPRFDAERYAAFKNGLDAGTYIAGTGEALPFQSEVADLIVASQLLDNIKDKKLVLKIIDEMLRILRTDGEIRIPDLTMPFYSENRRLSLESKSDDLYVQNGHEKKASEWLEILDYLQSKGCRLFSARRSREIRLVEKTTGRGAGHIPVYQGFIARKDEEIPQVKFQQPLEGESIPELIQLDPKASSPDNISYAAISIESE